MSDSQIGPSVYIYDPNKVAPIVFAILFAASMVWHLWQCIHYKCFKVTGLYLLTAGLFAVGFAVRAYGTYHIDDVNIYFASSLFIYLSPVLLELASYIVLCRVLYYVPYLTPLHPGHVLVTLGVISLFLEALSGIGVSYLTQPGAPDNSMQTGKTIMRVGLVLQLCVISGFCILAALFWYRCSKHGITSRNVFIPLITLYASMTLILTRTVFRCVEYFGSGDLPTQLLNDPSSISPLVRQEWYFYVFESGVMLLNSYLWNFMHPRRFLPEKKNFYLAQDGQSQCEGPEFKDRRPLMLKLMDPVGFTTIVGEFAQRNPMKERYWEIERVDDGNNEIRDGFSNRGMEMGARSRIRDEGHERLGRG